MSAGRPTLFRAEYCQMLIDHMKEGLSFESFGGVIGVSKQTLYDWEKANPEFLDAKGQGSSLSRIYWERLGRDNIINESFGKDGSKSLNGSVWIFNMKNRFGWRDRQKDEGPDTVVNNNVQVSDQQLEKLLDIARSDKGARKK